MSNGTSNGGRSILDLVKGLGVVVSTAVVLAGVVGAAYVIRYQVAALEQRVTALETEHRAHLLDAATLVAEFRSVQTQTTATTAAIADMHRLLIRICERVRCSERE